MSISHNEHERCTPDLDRLVAPGCTRVAADTAAQADPTATWRAIDCLDPDPVGRRHRVRAGDGDLHLTATAEVQPDNAARAFAYRSLSLQDTDEEHWGTGQRCELGKNDYRADERFDGSANPLLFHQGQRRLTFVSFRLPAASFDLGKPAEDFQIVMQMKATQPSDGGGGNPALALHASDHDGDGDGEWVLRRDHPDPHRGTLPVWCTRARPDVWTRFAFDVYYSANPERGKVRVYADLDGDGVAATDVEDDPDCRDATGLDTPTDERSEPLAIPTLTVETEHEGSDDDPLAPGVAIPSHLRVGLYQSVDAGCPGPPGPGPGGGGSCRVDIDNVQVLAIP